MIIRLFLRADEKGSTVLGDVNTGESRLLLRVDAGLLGIGGGGRGGATRGGTGITTASVNCSVALLRGSESNGDKVLLTGEYGDASVAGAERCRPKRARTADGDGVAGSA